MKKCACGSVDFELRVPTSGVWISCVRSVGETEYVTVWSSQDELTSGRQPKFIRCMECGKRAPNPYFVKG